MKLTRKMLRSMILEAFPGQPSGKKANLGEPSAQVMFASQDFERARDAYDRLLWNNGRAEIQPAAMKAAEDKFRASIERMKSAIAAMEEWLNDPRPVKRYD